MSKISLRKITLLNIVEFILVVCLIIDCESIWIWAVQYMKYAKLLSFSGICLSLIIFIIYGFHFNKTRRISQKELSSIIGIFIYLIIFILFNHYDSLNRLASFAIVIILFLLIYLFPIGKSHYINILKIYTNIMIIIAVISLIFWIFGSILGWIRPNGILTITRNRNLYNINSYSYIYFEVQKNVDWGINIFRNTAIFYESPKCSLNFCLALMYETFISPKPKKLKLLLLYIAIFSTLSTTGIIFLIINFILSLIISIPRYKLMHIIKFFILPVILLFFIFLSNFLMQMKIGGSSFFSHDDDYIAGFKTWLDYPIIGSGYNNMDAIREHMNSFRADNIGFSNSIFRVLAQGGIYLFILYFIPCLVSIINSIKAHNCRMLCFTILFIYLFIMTSFPYNYITIYILILLKNNNTKLIYEKSYANKA